MQALHRLPLLFLVGILGVTGCTDAGSSADEAAAPLVAADSGSLQLAYGPPDAVAADSLYPDSLKFEGMDAIDEVQAVDSVAASASNWRGADRAVRVRLDDASPVPTAIREQAAAHAMLLRYFGDDSLSVDQQEALGFYVEQLLEHRSPASPLVYPALAALRDHWPSSRLIAAIDTTLRATRESFRVHPEGVEPHIPEVHARVRAANEALVNLRDSLQSS